MIHWTRTARTFLTSMAAPLLLGGCLMNDPVDESISSAPPPPSPPANSAPNISGNPPRMIKVGVTYSFTPSASDPDSDPITFNVSNKPNWADFDSATGQLSGVPFLGSEGTYSNISIAVSDGSMSTALPEFSITVEPATAPNMPPEIDGTPPANVTVGSAYSFTPNATDPDGDFLTFSAQNVPAWATFNTTTGRLSGTPQAGSEGLYSNISISVSDGISSASLPAFSIRVNRANGAPTISGTPVTQVAAGQSYSFTPSASDPDGDTLVFSIENAPSWANFSTSTGTLSGQTRAGDEGSYANIRITVSDGTLTATLPAFTIVVDAAPLGSATLSWTPPTQNDDGSPLTDLSGYVIYYGTSPNNYSTSIPLNNAGLTTYVVNNLASNTYYFAITAVNSVGVQSGYSNTASKVIP